MLSLGGTARDRDPENGQPTRKRRRLVLVNSSSESDSEITTVDDAKAAKATNARVLGTPVQKGVKSKMLFPDDEEEQDTTYDVYKWMELNNTIVQPGMLALVKWDEAAGVANSDGKDTAIAYIDSFLLNAGAPSVYVSWCYTGSNIRQLPAGEEVLQMMEMHLGEECPDGDVFLSNVSDEVETSCIIQVVEADKCGQLTKCPTALFHGDVVFFPATNELVERALDRQELKTSIHRAETLDAFRDALAAQDGLVETTTFWRHIDAIFIQPNKQLGTDQNPRRKEFEATGYKSLQFNSIADPQLGRCAACNGIRNLTVKVTLVGSPSSALGLGSDCAEKLQRLASFFQVWSGARTRYAQDKGQTPPVHLERMHRACLACFAAKS